ncbi:hypothetical protein K493DRAFT_299254 [Basidiobolus meristosporus CBS 931.73]|uniref:3D domain-containing protein n=1 Tax=Basidiobolus meristosporus CBS 931.73 TaxID=1314790 RepID=A0A1Y1YNQ4_9FUNG|nr:hypothetical protein K493DRAFT_299254 [Basidiobolus meristosporus CBS 931.73]|eukprot:ORX99632.1 hypothetical protein K493DRAFT_299254 [Basidiobolus meristosporus CBS 931.73]
MISKFILFGILCLALFQTSVLAKSVKMTYYWIAQESDHSGSKSVTIKTCSGKRIAKVSRSFAKAARMEGTARLNSGKVINLDCDCHGGYSCFTTINQRRYPYGIGAKDNVLKPYVSVSANDIPIGTTLMVKQLKGLKMPNGHTHSGCVRVDDNGWSFGKNQIDFLVGSKKHYNQIDRKYSKRLDKVTIARSSCHPN